jgi:hypothetical protein
MQVHDADVGSATSAVLVAVPSALRTATGVHPGTSSVAVAGSGLVTRQVRSPLIPTAAYYSDAFGWPIAMDGEEISLVCGLTVDVLAVPAGLGGEVNSLLYLHDLGTPVIEHREGNASPRWMFLCESREGGSVERSLTYRGVAHLASGSLVRLPLSPVCASGLPRWITKPDKGTNERLPPWGAVFSLIRRAISR